MIIPSGIGKTNYQIPRSLRFRGSATAYLSRTPTTSTSYQKGTIAFWVKRGNLTSANRLHIYQSSYNASPYRSNVICFEPTTDELAWRFEYQISAGSGWNTSIGLTTNAVFRDTSAWMHIVCSWDTTQTLASNRAKIWINGIQVTSFKTEIYPVLNENLLVDTNGYTNFIGDTNGKGVFTQGTPFDGYLAEYYRVDGQALDVSLFGEFDSISGQWVAKPYTGTYGANGFYLPFSDTSSVAALGYDKKPNVASAYTFTDTFDTFTGWVVTQNSNTSGATAGVSGGSLVATSYGTGSGWHGATVSKTLPNIGDFDITFNNVVVGNTSGDMHGLYMMLYTSDGTTITWGFEDAWSDDNSDTLVNSYVTVNGTKVTSTVMQSFSGDVRLVRSGTSLSYYRGGTFIGTYTCNNLALTSMSIVFDNYAAAPVPTQSLGGVSISGTQNTGVTLNNWTPNNISLAVTNAYNLPGYDVINGSGMFGTSLPPVGNGTNSLHFPRSNTTYTFNTTFTANSKIELYCYTDNSANTNPCTVTANGGTAKTVPSSASSYNWVKVDLGVTSLTSITVSNSSWPGTDFWVAGLIIDDVYVAQKYFSSTTYDSMLDAPLGGGGSERGNYVVLNALDTATTMTISNAALRATTAYNAQQFAKTIPLPTGKWYAEFSHGNIFSDTVNYVGAVASGGTTLTRFYSSSGQQYNGSAWNTYGSAWAYPNTIGIAADTIAGTIEFFRDGISQGQLSFGTGDIYLFVSAYISGGLAYVDANFGQRPFKYTPPTGFKPIHTGNFPNPTIAKPNKHFDVVTWSGNATYPRDIGGIQFQPDLLWQKTRNIGTDDHLIMDSVRGTGTEKWISSSRVEGEGIYWTNANVSQFNTDGFRIAQPSATDVFNALGRTDVAWLWKAGGAAVTNNAGTISSQVSANTTAGFSIVTYTGNGTVGATVGHGLGVAPAMIIIKARNNTTHWPTYHKAANVSPASGCMDLQSTAAFISTTTPWNSVAPSSTVFTVSNSGAGNGYDTSLNANNYVAYCFAEIAGYSKFGSYTGNGSADGPFVHCGFRPRFVMFKRTDSAASWYVIDSARDTANEEQSFLYPNLNNADTIGVAGGYRIDFTSNGLKLRGNGADINASGGTYIYAAFAEVPFKYANAR